MQKNLKLFIVALFGSIMFVSRLFVPAPIDRMLIALDAVLLALSSLFVKKFGATYTGALGGILTSLWRPSLIPFSIIFSFFYGILVDMSFFIFKVKGSLNGVNRNRLMLAMALSTLLIGFLSYYLTATFPQIIQPYIALDLIVAFISPITGAVGGYAAAYLWNRYLKSIQV